MITRPRCPGLRRLAALSVLSCCVATASFAISDLRPAAVGAGDDDRTAPRERLLEELGRLMDEVSALRAELAEARLAESRATRELEELRQFIHDHESLGRDFQQYHAIKTLAEQDARARDAAERRERLEEERAARRARYEEIRAKRAAESAELSRLERYERAGFAEIGLDVFAGRMGFSYKTRGRQGARVDYDPFIGLYYRPGGVGEEIDYGEMTISGSVLNASEELRNLGIAITFFDETGNQVGSETVQINNARPNVPYPFTTSVAMALDRPFASSSVYVLYADPVAP